MTQNNEQPDAGMRERAEKVFAPNGKDSIGWIERQAMGLAMDFAAAEFARAVEAAVKDERERVAAILDLIVKGEWSVVKLDVSTLAEQLRTADPRTGVVEGEK